MKKVMIISPFWDQPPNVSIYRVKRFVSWLKEKGYDISIVRQGLANETYEKEGIKVISVKNSTMALGTKIAWVADKLRLRPLKLIWNKTLYYQLHPDEYGVWANSVVRSKQVLKECKNCSFILSTCPPHSATKAGHVLAEKCNKKHFVDMRDGWLDEPLRPYLNSDNKRKRKEEKLEKEILEKASVITVTSDEWKNKLNSRLPFTVDKTEVLFNGYPEISSDQQKYFAEQKSERKGLVLVYGGNLQGNPSISRLEAMLEAFYLNPEIKGEIILKLFSNVGRKDLSVLAKYKERIEKSDIKMDLRKPVSRDELFKEMACADGLLLPSISGAAIPSKMFEYILFRKPVLSITMKNSAVWHHTEKIEGFFNFEVLVETHDWLNIHKFLNSCYNQPKIEQIPDSFTFEELKKVFFETLKNVV